MIMKTPLETYAVGLALSHRALERTLSRFSELAERREPAPLADMLPADELAAMMAAVQKANRARAIAMASFLATSLEPQEQRTLLGDAPWMFRKVLLPLGVRRMRRFGELVHTREIAL
jgi:hypothetical protein